jgi:L-aminopeptidase/D-esterase-like protein
MEHAIKGGIGTARIALPGGLLVAALMAVNSYGGVVDHRTGETVAGPRGDQKPQLYDSAKLLIEGRGAAPSASTGENTTIGVVATNASLTKEQANHLARVSHDGLALTVRPCHTPRDGDTIFAMATCAIEVMPDLTLLGTGAVEATGQAVLNAVRSATGLGVIPSAGEWCGG